VIHPLGLERLIARRTFGGPPFGSFGPCGAAQAPTWGRATPGELRAGRPHGFSARQESRVSRRDDGGAAALEGVPARCDGLSRATGDGARDMTSKQVPAT
jgi:hypothetical protein